MVLDVFKVSYSTMDEVKNAENELFNKSSMSVVELNNYVSILRDFLALGNGMTNYPIGLHRTQSDYAGPYCTCESVCSYIRIIWILK